MKIPVSVEVLTLNSGKTLARCLESLGDFAEVIVLDGNSTDDTHEIAAHFGARILPQSESAERGRKIENFAEVRNRGLRAALHDWFLFVDSDEYLSKEVVEEIRAIVAAKGTTQVYRMPRKYVVDGVVIERSSMYPNFQTRFFNREAVTEFVKPIHERIQPKEGEVVGVLQHPTLVPFEGKEEILEKWRRYAEKQIKGMHLSWIQVVPFTLKNLVQFLKYAIKYLLTLVGKGPRMPFVYEWHNALYHLRLIGGAWRTLWL